MVSKRFTKNEEKKKNTKTLSDLSLPGTHLVFGQEKL